MTATAFHLDDPSRLKALQDAALLDTPPEESFDRLTRLAARVLGVPISLVSFVDKDRQFFKSAVGLPESLAMARQTPLSHSFCQHAVLTGEPLIVRDAREHPVLKDNPAVPLGVVAYAGIPLVTPDGLVLGSFCVIDTQPREWTAEQIEMLRDLSASAMTEIELRRRNDELRQTNKAKDRFIAMLSHDLRTPLTPALITAAELAEDATLPAHARDDARLIRRNLELELLMIDSLLDLTRIASGKLWLDTRHVDVHAAIRASAAMCEADALVKSMELRLELRAARSALRADPAKLQQVFCNLFKNAIKFGDPDSRITVRSSDEGPGSLRIDVSDVGVGIAADVLPHVFEAYEQGDVGGGRRFGGLGLGLAICKGIVEAHGGVISAASAGHGTGATMSVLLPWVPVEEGSRTVRPPESPRRPAMKILLVEDHADSLWAMTKLLRKLEYRVTPATSVGRALEAAAAEDFDLVISDLGLPDGTGLQLMRTLLARRPMKGIALTGYGAASDIRETQEAGFLRHLTKPVNFLDLETAILEIA